jgi:iron-sulfur cluster repair protein YtfE (RIC family)
VNDLHKAALSDLDLNEAARPKMVPIKGATASDRHKGKHLAMIHRHYLSEMAQIADILDRIKAGDQPPAALAKIVLNSDMRQNFEVAGTICGHQCKVLTMHHNIEEHQMFPALAAQGNTELTNVVDKLRAEHLVIHELLKRLERSALAIERAPNEKTFKAAYDVFFKLRHCVLSHFGYEETELEEAIGVYLGGI